MVLIWFLLPLELVVELGVELGILLLKLPVN